MTDSLILHSLILQTVTEHQSLCQAHRLRVGIYFKGDPSQAESPLYGTYYLAREIDVNLMITETDIPAPW